SGDSEVEENDSTPVLQPPKRNCGSSDLFQWRSGNFMPTVHNFNSENKGILHVPQWKSDAGLWTELSRLETQVVNTVKTPHFICKLCGKSFTHRDSLTHHKSSHQGQTQATVGEPTSPS
ncbi:hypothetical protein L9F63_018871, partial [Diploptera punctata]